MTGPISRDRLLESLKEAASWPGADRNTVVTLATALVAARADAEGSSYFRDLSERDPADATAQALAGSRWKSSLQACSGIPSAAS